MADLVEEIERLLTQCSLGQRRSIFRQLRQEFPIHSLEEQLNTPAEVILEAIHRAPEITLRGIRGIIAEAEFVTTVVSLLKGLGWQDKEIVGDRPYDVLLGDDNGDVRIQVKMQRLTKHQPTVRSEYPGMFVVETQRTRSGRRRTSENVQEKTRPYRFGDFDILAVSLHPSSGRWSDFRYTVATWLLPDKEDHRLLRVFQPVSPEVNDDWTDDLLQVIGWHRAQQRKTIRVQANAVP